MTWVSYASNQHVPTATVQDAVDTGDLELLDDVITGLAANILWNRNNYQQFINHDAAEINGSGISGSQHMTKGQMVLYSAFVPDAPILSVSSVGSGSITLTWTEPVLFPLFVLYRSTTNKATPAEGDIINGNADTPYIDSGLNNGTAYYYWVTVTSPGGTSDFSNRVNATPVAVITTPTGFDGFGGANEPTFGEYLAFLSWSNSGRSENKTLEIFNISVGSWQVVTTSIGSSAEEYEHVFPLSNGPTGISYENCANIDGDVDYRIRFNSESDWAETTVSFSF
jgi:hypothetical protein